MEADQVSQLCAHQIHVIEGSSGAVPTLVCSCPAGLIHMHDCPVAMGLECAHFLERTESVESVSIPAQEEIRLRLMDDYLSRAYSHRLRSLTPAGDPWQMRREHLAAEFEADGLFEESALEQSAEDVERADAAYEQEKDLLISQRKKREQQRQEQEERSREERAHDRARRGIKTVVEKARESVAQQGNVTSSFLDDRELPSESSDPQRKKRRRRRRKPRGEGGEGGAGVGPGATPVTGEASERRPRRRRRVRSGDKRPQGGQAAQGGRSEKTASGESNPKPRRRRRRRRGGGGGGGGGGAGSGSSGGGAPAP